MTNYRNTPKNTKKLADYAQQLARLKPHSTRRQAKLDRLATLMLKRDGFYLKGKRLGDDSPVDADAIGAHGLRPTWHGRA